jgi:hypothetical protein
VVDSLRTTGHVIIETHINLKGMGPTLPQQPTLRFSHMPRIPDRLQTAKVNALTRSTLVAPVLPRPTYVVQVILPSKGAWSRAPMKFGPGVA